MLEGIISQQTTNVKGILNVPYIRGQWEECSITLFVSGGMWNSSHWPLEEGSVERGMPLILRDILKIVKYTRNATVSESLEVKSSKNKHAD